MNTFIATVFLQKKSMYIYKNSTKNIYVVTQILSSERRVLYRNLKLIESNNNK